MAHCAEEPSVAPLPAAGHALRQPRGRESGSDSGAESRAESGGGEPGGGRRTAGAAGALSTVGTAWQFSSSTLADIDWMTEPPLRTSQDSILGYFRRVHGSFWQGFMSTSDAQPWLSEV